MSIDKVFLSDMAAKFDFDLNSEQLNKFEQYAKMLVEWNERVNLTAITQPNEIAIKHFVDSLLLFKAADIKENASMIDVGTGAGFPAIPCKILREDLDVTLLDSLNKRVNFLQAVSDELELDCHCVHSRAEDGGKNPDFREKFDIATARAVAHLRELSEYCIPYVKVNGYFIALKGYEIEEELQEAKKAIAEMGGEVVEVKKFILPDESKRGIVVIKKISQTPTKYPRMTAKIKKSPLK